MIEVQVPKMGMSTVEVEIVSVPAKVGDLVNPGDELVEIEGDKATFMIEAEVTGTVMEILVEPGEERQVGDVVARIEPPGPGG